MNTQLELKNEFQKNSTCVKTKHILIVWNNAIHVADDIEKYLVSQFNLISRRTIQWSDTKFEENMSRFYGTKLPSIRDKVIHCGKGDFFLFFFEDIAAELEIVSTSSAPQLVNKRVFMAKQLFRSWLGGGHQIHASNNDWETERDIALLLNENQILELESCADTRVIESDLIGANGWNSLEHLFNTMNKCLDYVVLRNYESLLTTEKFDIHSDIDFLVRDYEEAATLMNATKIHSEPYRKHFYLIVANQKIFIDLRAVGDSYYDRHWQNEILASRQPYECFYVPDPLNHYFSLLYHALIHKKNIASDYIEAFARLRDPVKDNNAYKFPNVNLMHELDNFMAAKRFAYTRPDDLSVYFNTQRLKGQYRDVNLNSKYSLPVGKQLRVGTKKLIKILVNCLPYQTKVKIISYYKSRQ